MASNMVTENAFGPMGGAFVVNGKMDILDSELKCEPMERYATTENGDRTALFARRNLPKRKVLSVRQNKYQVL